MSKFYVWVDDNNLDENVLSSADFSEDSQRSTGFQANTVASAKRVNTALRQANLVAVAMMEALGISDSCDVTSSVDDVKAVISASSLFKLQKLFTFIDTSNYGMLNYSLLPDGERTLGASTNQFFAIYTDRINGVLIDDIFTSKDSSIVKNSMTSKNYDTDSGTIKDKFASIETRLTNLGFKSGQVKVGTNSSDRISVGSIKRQGNYVIIEIDTTTTKTSSSTKFYIEPNDNVDVSIFFPKDKTGKFTNYLLCRMGASECYMSVMLNHNPELYISISLEYDPSTMYTEYFSKACFGYEANPL